MHRLVLLALSLVGCAAAVALVRIEGWTGAELSPLAATGGTSAPAARAVEVDAPRTGASVRIAATSARSVGETILEVVVVSQDDGRPVAEASVFLRARDELAPASWYYLRRTAPDGGQEVSDTDGAGRTWGHLEPHTSYELSVEREDGSVGCAGIEVRALSAGERRRVTVAIPTAPDRRVHVRVVSEADGAPIEGAAVGVQLAEWVLDVRADREALLEETVTDAEGVFSTLVPSWNRTFAVVEAEGFEPGLIELCAGHATAADALTLVLARAGTLELFVPDAQPVGELTLEARIQIEGPGLLDACDPRDFLDVGYLEWRAALDETGRVTLAGLPTRFGLELELLRDGEPVWMTPEPIALEPGERHRVTVHAGSSRRIVGQLVDAASGEALYGRELWLQPALRGGSWVAEYHDRDSVYAHAKSDEDGRFTFERVAPGSWRLGPAPTRSWDDAAAAPWHLAPYAELLAVEPGDEDVLVTLRAHRGLYLCGLVLDAVGDPVRTSVWSYHDGDWSAASVDSDEDGRFCLGPLIPGTYELVARARHGDATSRPLRVSTDEQHPIVLRLLPGARLAGRLTANGARAARAAWVTCVPRTGPEADAPDEWEVDWLYEEEETAEFESGALLPGEYDVIATTGRDELGVLRDVRLRAGDALEGLELELRPGATLDLSIAAPGTWREVRVWCEGRRWPGAWVERSEPARVVVPPGVARLRVLDEDGALVAERSVSLAVGERVTVELP